MKKLILFLFLATCSFSAFSQKVPRITNPIIGSDTMTVYDIPYEFNLQVVNLPGVDAIKMNCTCDVDVLWRPKKEGANERALEVQIKKELKEFQGLAMVPHDVKLRYDKYGLRNRRMKEYLHYPILQSTSQYLALIMLDRNIRRYATEIRCEMYEVEYVWDRSKY